jgi:hypothetical protein
MTHQNCGNAPNLRDNGVAQVRLDGGPLGVIEARGAAGRPAPTLRPAPDQAVDQAEEEPER